VKSAQHWLLALLCLAASFVYLTRQTEPNGMTVSKMAQMAAMPGNGSNIQEFSMAMDGQMEPPFSVGQSEHMALSSHRAQAAVPASPELTTSAPNAPPLPTDHSHAGHCPFCFTAAFALRADRTVFFTVVSGTALPAEQRYVRPDLVTLGHPDARGPPV